MKITADIFAFHSRRRLGRERNEYQEGEQLLMGKKGEGEGNFVFLSPPLNVHSNSKSNMAGWIEQAYNINSS